MSMDTSNVMWILLMLQFTTTTMSENPILWQPGDDRVKASAMYRFMRDQGFDNYDQLFDWSIADLPAFWQAVCEFCEVHFDAPAEQPVA